MSRWNVTMEGHDGRSRWKATMEGHGETKVTIIGTERLYSSFEEAMEESEGKRSYSRCF
jgi:hypothetical protein